jgi:hypothetical protein
MKTLSLILCTAFTSVSLSITTFASAATPQTKSCSSAIANVKSKLSKQGNPVLRSQQERIQQNSWKSAPKGNLIAIVFKGNSNWLRNSDSGSQFSRRILNSCSQIKVVSFTPDQSDDTFYYGRVKGELALFEGVSCGIKPEATPKWGSFCIPGG